jgi:hypothetical protein
MTEVEWLASYNPDRLLKWLQKSKRHRPTRRKLGLFACACARRLGDQIDDEATATGLNLAERMAEGVASQDEFLSFLRSTLSGPPRGRFIHVAVWAVRVLDTAQGWSTPEGAARSVAGYVADALGSAESAEQCRLLREVLGNPYRPVALCPAWRTEAVLALAQAAYDYRVLHTDHLDSARLAVLCDALLDAGCPEDHEILLHLRGSGPHVRGCFVLDAVIGRE